MSDNNIINTTVADANDETIVLHLIVVGFHHKKGCLVEYCYPPFVADKDTAAGDTHNTRNHSSITPSSVATRDDSAVAADDNSVQTSPVISDDTSNQSETTATKTVAADETIVLPHIWKTLPSLALPDGSHNHERDAIYFHLPDRSDHNRTIFGVSCYRQINANKLKARTSDVTRGTVQKSVVVLCRLPLYGLIEAKLEMITHAYFRELDFSKVSLLEETYHNLNAQLTRKLIQSQELYVGLATRQLVVDFHHKIVVLFKLLLLERKVLFYKSPVKPLCVSILALCSLMPGLIRQGLSHCSVSVHPKNRTTSGRQLSADIELSPARESLLNDHRVVNDGDDDECLVLTTDANVGHKPTADDKDDDSLAIEGNCDDNNKADNTCGLDTDIVVESQPQISQTVVEDSDEDLFKEIDEVLSKKSSSSKSSSAKSSPDKDQPSPPAQRSQSIFYDIDEPKPERLDNMASDDQQRVETPPILKLRDEDCGLPLEIFSCGSYLQPYLSLTYLDVLSDVRVRSCLVGATNFLFKQKKDIFDVIVELDEGKVDILDQELRKQLALTTEDSRFAEYLTKTVLKDGENGDIFVDGTGWEGSDEWIRYQFKVYLLHMLRSSEMDDNTKDYQSFNPQFMNAWRSTHNYKMWCSVSHPSVFDVTAGHPFGGQLGISDMKLKLSQLFYGSKAEQNKRINQTVMRTSKAMGGAVTTAKSTVSSAITGFWNSWSPKTTISSTTTTTTTSTTTTTNTNSEQQIGTQIKRPEAETQL